MNATTGDPCLCHNLYADEKNTDGVIVLELDDFYGLGTVEFLKDEDEGSH